MADTLVRIDRSSTKAETGRNGREDLEPLRSNVSMFEVARQEVEDLA